MTGQALLALLAGLAGAATVDGLRAWRRRNDPTLTRIRDRRRVVRWSSTPDGRVTRRITVEGLPPEAAGELIGHADALLARLDEDDR